MYIVPELQSECPLLYSLHSRFPYRIYMIEYERHHISHKKSFRLQTPRAIRLDASGRPNRRLGPSNCPPRAVFPIQPTPFPFGVGSISLLTRLLFPVIPSFTHFPLSVTDKYYSDFRRGEAALGHATKKTCGFLCPCRSFALSLH